MDPGAPNLAIKPLQRAVSALGVGSGVRSRAIELGQLLDDAIERDSDDADLLFARRVVNLQRVSQDLRRVGVATLGGAVRAQVLQLRRDVASVRLRVSNAESEASSRLRALEDDSAAAGTDEEKRVRSNQRELVRMEIAALRRLSEPIFEIDEFVEGIEGKLLAEASSILLLGDWGTGKTHFLCDSALHALDDGAPVLIVLASEIRSDIHPLDAIAEATTLSTSGRELLAGLDAEAISRNRRAMILIDAVNESDRDAWRKWLPRLLRDIEKAPNVGLVVSCRSPFDVGVISDRARARMIELRHPGFEDQEFDAQLEFFRYYDLPALHVPLLSLDPPIGCRCVVDCGCVP